MAGVVVLVELYGSEVSPASLLSTGLEDGDCDGDNVISNSKTQAEVCSL